MCKSTINLRGEAALHELENSYDSTPWLQATATVKDVMRMRVD